MSLPGLSRVNVRYDRDQSRISADLRTPLGLQLYRYGHRDPDIDFVKLAASQGVVGERVEAGRDLPAALERGIKAARDGKSYLVEVVIARLGGGAESTWHESFNLAARRKRGRGRPRSGAARRSSTRRR